MVRSFRLLPVLSLISLVFFNTLNTWFAAPSNCVRQSTNLNYSSSLGGVDPADVTSFDEFSNFLLLSSKGGPYRIHEIQVSMLFSRPTFVSSFPNLLSTASYNDGIRIELGSSNSGALLIGSGRKDGTFDAVPFTLSGSDFEYIEFSIIFGDSELEIRMLLNNTSLAVTLPIRSIELDNLVVANGFDGTRPFAGDLFVFLGAQSC